MPRRLVPAASWDGRDERDGGGADWTRKQLASVLGSGKTLRAASSDTLKPRCREPSWLRFSRLHLPPLTPWLGERKKGV